MEHKNKRTNSTFSLVPDVIDAAPGDQGNPLGNPEPLYDQNQQLVAVRIGDRIVPVQRDPNRFEELVDIDTLNDAYRTGINAGLKGLQAAEAQRQVVRGQIDIEFADSPVRLVRAPWEKFVYDNGHHRAQRETRQQMGGLLRGIGQAQAANIAVTAAALVTGQERRVSAAYEQQDYDRAWQRHVQETQFESHMGLESTRLAYGHEMAMAQEANTTRVRLAELEAERAAAERADTAAEAEKEREMRLIEGVRGMFSQVTDMIAELRLTEQTDPTARVANAVSVLNSVATILASPPEGMTVEEQKRWAASLRPLVDQALQEAMKVVKRG